jgi:hypothetical protein
MVYKVTGSCVEIRQTCLCALISGVLFPGRSPLIGDDIIFDSKKGCREYEWKNDPRFAHDHFCRMPRLAHQDRVVHS